MPETSDLLRRRSQRVSARIAIRLEAAGLRVEGHTAVVNDHGALVLAPLQAEPGTQLTVTNRTTGQRATCHVVWSGDETREHEYKLGLELLGDHPGFWGLDFAPSSEDDRVSQG